MLSEESFSSASVSLNDLFGNFTHEFLRPFEQVVEPDIYKEIYLDFDVSNRSSKKRINPFLRLAKSEDARDIVEIYKELYEGTYPYKEMEDETEVRNMIESNTCDWVLFKDKSGTTLGCFTFLLDYTDKKGYIRGLMVKKQYQGLLDVIKGVIGSYLGMYSKYKDRIFRWYCENRTAHTKSQYALSLGGIKPIGFYPNKDVFLGKVESDIMHICYDERTLREYRSPQTPQVLPEVKPCFQYSNERYQLGDVEYISPKIKLDSTRIKILKNQLQKTHTTDKFNYKSIIFTFKDSDSYFTFLYTPSVQNFEKTKYKVNNLEELFVFVQEFMAYQKQYGVLYSEIFLSAYNPSHQKIFLNAGFKPRGYIPSWKYNERENYFEDCILFNCFKGKISENIQLIAEGKELLKVLRLSPPKKSILSSFRFIEKVINNSYSTKIKNSFDSISSFKQCLKRSLAIYLSLIFVSYLIAASFGSFLHTMKKFEKINIQNAYKTI